LPWPEASRGYPWTRREAGGSGAAAKLAKTRMRREKRMKTKMLAFAFFHFLESGLSVG
jgi:hypothetical protein